MQRDHSRNQVSRFWPNAEAFRPMVAHVMTIPGKTVMKSHASIIAAIGFSVLCMPLIVRSAAPPVVSQIVSVSQPLHNEFSQRLNGTDPDAEYFGNPSVVGDLVHVYFAPDGTIYPPDAQGNPDSRNILLRETRIGIGASVKEAQPGTFSVNISPRPASGMKIFVRVFNAPEMSEASFYQDSQLFTVSWTVNVNFDAVFNHGLLPIDTADDDNDGSINSWEISNRTDPNLSDTDGDGIMDSDELVSGTDPTNGDSIFTVANIYPIPPNQVLVTWKSESNRVYTIESGLGLNDEIVFSPVTVVNGNGANKEVLIPASSENPSFYRIKVKMATVAE